MHLARVWTIEINVDSAVRIRYDSPTLASHGVERWFRSCENHQRRFVNIESQGNRRASLIAAILSCRQRAAGVRVPDFRYEVDMRKDDVAREWLAPVGQGIDLPTLDAAVLKTELGRNRCPVDRLGVGQRCLPTLCSGIDDLPSLQRRTKTLPQPLRVAGVPQHGPVAGHCPATDEDPTPFHKLENAAGFVERAHVVDEYQSREVVRRLAALPLEPCQRVRAGPIDGIQSRNRLIFGQVVRTLGRIGTDRVNQGVGHRPSGLEHPLGTRGPGAEGLHIRPPGHVAVQVNLGIDSPARWRYAGR